MNPKIDLDHVCALANLRLTKNEKKLLGPQMIKIVNWVNKLEELEMDVSKGEVYSSVSFSLPFREDNIKPSLPAREALANSPEKSEGLVKVPKVFEVK
ncbi:MAG: Asp-tRNA(Asn)/Glu-tRNA(Gln) amidotransferase subunit GatC [Candidatus Aminicenantes bacterium]|nr:Asp-tRNA(Asn)/Glu-tRNA(Gln) amidotransferase subunit GatC [Candidatus Aminicenantes bacterium]